MSEPAVQKNIAILGTAPHFAEAPFTDPDWQIWTASYHLFSRIPRWDVWFEIHNIERLKVEGQFTADLEALLKADAGKPIFMQDQHEEFPNSLPVPRAALEAEFGQFFFTSTFAWMLAMAIQLKPAKIGLFGVDCAAAGEYADQRPAAQFFMEMARQRGIEVVLPKTSLLAVRKAHYGIEDLSHAELLMIERLRVLRLNREAGLEAHRKTVRDLNVVDGAISVIEDLLSAYMGHDTTQRGKAPSIYKENS